MIASKSLVIFLNHAGENSFRSRIRDRALLLAQEARSIALDSFMSDTVGEPIHAIITLATSLLILELSGIIECVDWIFYLLNMSRRVMEYISTYEQLGLGTFIILSSS